MFTLPIHDGCMLIVCASLVPPATSAISPPWFANSNFGLSILVWVLAVARTTMRKSFLRPQLLDKLPRTSYPEFHRSIPWPVSLVVD